MIKDSEELKLKPPPSRLRERREKWLGGADSLPTSTKNTGKCCPSSSKMFPRAPSTKTRATIRTLSSTVRKPMPSSQIGKSASQRKVHTAQFNVRNRTPRICWSDTDSEDDFAVMSRRLEGRNKMRWISQINRNETNWSSDSEDENASIRKIISKKILESRKVEQFSCKLDIDGGRRGEDDDFPEQLKATGLSIFHPIADLGYFSWEASGDYKSLSSIKSTNEILHHIDLEGKPDSLKPIIQIETPKRFQSPKSTAYKSKFPYSEIDIACIHVAVKRGVNFDEVDFCFGGSTLEMLANKDASDPFIAARIPGTKCILVAKKKDYTQNLADVGFQFERYVTGGSMLDTTGSPKNVEHIHTMQIGEKTVLFQAEVDAMDANGSAIEVKSSNLRYWGTQVMFQMISSGSTKLCHGEKSTGFLTGVTLKSLSNVSLDALEYANISSLQKNIVQGMDAIQSQLKDDGTYRVSFTGGSLELVPASTRVFCLFPPDHIVKALIS